MAAIQTTDRPTPPSVVGLTTEDLLARAVESARSIYIRKGTPEPRWVAVRSCLTLIETRARRLIVWAGLDPDEPVHR